MSESKFLRKLNYTKFTKWLLVILIGLSFTLAIIAYLIDLTTKEKDSVYLGYGELSAPETNQMSIIVDEFAKSTFLANASVTIGRNNALPIASVSDEIILIMYDVTSEILTQKAFPLMLKSKSTNAAFFQASEKIKIPALGKPSLYPFDNYLIAVFPMYMMNEIGFNLPDKANMVLKLPQHLKVKAVKEIKIDRPWFQPIMSHKIDCKSGCGIKDKIFIFKVSHAWWYRLAIMGLLICLFIPLFVVLKSDQLSTASELLALILSIVAVRTFILGYQTGQLFLLDFYFGAYFVVWLFVQLFRIKQ